MPLTSWKSPFTRWLTRKTPAAPPQSAQPPAPPTDTSAAVAVSPLDLAPYDTRALFLSWLLGATNTHTATASATANPTRADEAAPIALLDAALATDTALANLLPRAAQIVPQLMKTLRDERYSAADVAQRIARDVVLKTEVLRLANGLHYGGGREPVTDLAHAVAALGTDGLQRAIAKVVLRPIFESRSAPLSLVAAPRIWQVSEDKARLCVALAPGFAVTPLDAYLAGLLHDIGWTAAFRILDAAKPPPAADLLARPDTASALFSRRDRLFGKLVGPWQLSVGLVALANELGTAGPATSPSMAAQMLGIADHLALCHSLQQAKLLPPEPPSLLGGLPALVGQTYRGLAAERPVVQ